MLHDNSPRCQSVGTLSSVCYLLAIIEKREKHKERDSSLPDNKADTDAVYTEKEIKKRNTIF
jgi:hypothetical protein